MLWSITPGASVPRNGGRAVTVSLDEGATVAPERSADLVAIDDALTALAAFDARKSQIVELRFFGGLSVEETAEVLNVSPPRSSVSRPLAPSSSATHVATTRCFGATWRSW